MEQAKDERSAIDRQQLIDDSLNLAIAFANFHAEFPALTSTTPDRVGEETPSDGSMLIPMPISTGPFCLCDLQCFFGLSCQLSISS